MSQHCNNCEYILVSNPTSPFRTFNLLQVQNMISSLEFAKTIAKNRSEELLAEDYRNYDNVSELPETHVLVRTEIISALCRRRRPTGTRFWPQ